MSAANIPEVRSDQTLADLVASWAGASRVFHRHHLDFCCRGDQTLAEACREQRLPLDALLAELRAELAPLDPKEDWSERPLAQLLAHILDTFHASHREELPRLLAMAEKVERVHGDKPECPRGLAAHLAHMLDSLEQHMQKEERILFPMILEGHGRSAFMPVQCMIHEHDEHGRNLAHMRTLAHGFEAPPAACGTWRALYTGLRQLEQDVMAHVHLENHVLFPRALQG